MVDESEEVHAILGSTALSHGTQVFAVAFQGPLNLIIVNVMFKGLWLFLLT